MTQKKRNFNSHRKVFFSLFSMFLRMIIFFPSQKERKKEKKKSDWLTGWLASRQASYPALLYISHIYLIHDSPHSHDDPSHSISTVSVETYLTSYPSHTFPSSLPLFPSFFPYFVFIRPVGPSSSFHPREFSPPGSSRLEGLSACMYICMICDL